MLGCGESSNGSTNTGAPTDRTSGPVPTTANCPSPTGATHFVSPRGDDAADGTQDAPWRTLQHAAQHVEPGDGVFLRGGTYTEPLVIERSGEEGKAVLFAAADPTQRPVIDGSNLSLEDGLVRIAGQSHVVLCNLTVRSSSAHGVMVTDSDEGIVSSHVTLLGMSVEDAKEAGIYLEDVEDCSIEDSTTYFSVSSGIGVWYSTRISVRNNTVVNARYDEEHGHEESVSISGTSDFEVSGNEVYLEAGVPCTPGNAAIKAKEGSQRGQIFGNTVHDFFPEGHISLDAWDAGLNGTTPLNSIELFGNRIVSSGGIRVSSEQDGIVEDVNIYNNLVLFTDNGIMVTDAGTEGPRRNISIFNNTIYEGNDEWFNGVTVMTSNVSNIVIRNNLIVSDYNIGKILVSDEAVLPEVTVDHNLVFGPTGCYDDQPSCTDLSDIPENVVADPRFVAPEAGDYHLDRGSPAIDGGREIEGLGDDFDGVPRPQGAGIDIGAFEFEP